MILNILYTLIHYLSGEVVIQTGSCHYSLRSCCLPAHRFHSDWHFLVSSQQKIKKRADREDLALYSDSILHSLIQKHFDKTKMCGEYIAVATCDYACFETGMFLKQ